MPEPAPWTETGGIGPLWASQSWRLTAFLSSVAPPSEQDWWTRIIGQEPDTRSASPKQGLRQEQGAYSNGTLILSTQPGRVDWLYSSEVPGDAPTSDDRRTLGPVAESLERFRAVALPWLMDSPHIVRLAVGAVLQRPAIGRDDAYRLIMEMVPGLRLDSPGCSDFVYQINRPRPSKTVPERAINRLSKWSANAVQVVQFDMMLADPSIHLISQPTFSAQLELDLSTSAPEKSDLELADLPPLFEELVTLGLEIAVSGDIP